jgi:hypothetical protein
MLEFAKEVKFLVLNGGVLNIISLISDVEAGKHGAEAASEPSWIHELGTSSYLYLNKQNGQPNKKKN